MTDPTRPSRCKERNNWADLRAALVAGPKGGKWTWKQVGSFSTPGCAIFWPDTSKGGVHYRRLDSGGGMEQADAEFIACAHPDMVRALLADFEEAERALILSGKVNKDLMDTVLRLRKFIENEATKAERNGHVSLAKRCRAALAQEQGESDG